MYSMVFRVLLQPISFFTMDFNDYIVNSLNRMFSGLEFYVSDQVLLPPITAYDWSRRQYYSPHIIEYVHKKFSRLGFDFIVCFGDVDAYSNDLNFVFGEAHPGYKVACVYTRRLKLGVNGDKKIYYERILKEIIHELGHLLGLPHCSNPRCVMRFSNSLIEVDFKDIYFCDRCSLYLSSLGIIQHKS